MSEIESSVPGNKGLSLTVDRNNRGTDELPEVFLIRRQTKDAIASVPGIVFTQVEAYKVIEAIAEAADLIVSGSSVGGGGVVIRKPEDPVEASRREDVAAEIFGYQYGALDSNERKAVTRILELEKKAGVQW